MSAAEKPTPSAPPSPPIPDKASAASDRQSVSAGARLRNYFLTGLVVAGPVAITLWLTWTFVTWVDNLVRPLIPMQYRPESYLPWTIPGTGLIIAFFALTMLGFLTANLVGRTLVDMGERLLDRMPLVRSVYKGLKQVFETLFSESASSFRKVGLVEFPAPGMWSLVFLSVPPGPRLADQLPPEDYVSAFMPCTPNPTTGFFFYVPRSKIVELDMSVEAAAKLVMSAGMIQPNGDDYQKRLGGLAAMAAVVHAAHAVHAPNGGTPAPAALDTSVPNK